MVSTGNLKKKICGHSENIKFNWTNAQLCVNQKFKKSNAFSVHASLERSSSQPQKKKTCQSNKQGAKPLKMKRRHHQKKEHTVFILCGTYLNCMYNIGRTKKSRIFLPRIQRIIVYKGAGGNVLQSLSRIFFYDDSVFTAMSLCSPMKL